MLARYEGNVLAALVHIFAALKHHGTLAKLYQTQGGKESARTGTYHHHTGGTAHILVADGLEVELGRHFVDVGLDGEVDKYGALAGIDAALAYAQGIDGTHIYAALLRYVLLECLLVIGYVGRHTQCDVAVVGHVHGHGGQRGEVALTGGLRTELALGGIVTLAGALAVALAVAVAVAVAFVVTTGVVAFTLATGVTVAAVMVVIFFVHSCSYGYGKRVFFLLATRWCVAQTACYANSSRRAASTLLTGTISMPGCRVSSPLTLPSGMSMRVKPNLAASATR